MLTICKYPGHELHYHQQNSEPLNGLLLQRPHNLFILPSTIRKAVFEVSEHMLL